MTMSEKILARASKNSKVSAGDIIWANIDKAMMDDILGPRLEIAEKLEQLNLKIWDKDRVIVISDHYTPPANAKQAEIVKFTREWSEQNGINNYYEFEGPCHQLMVEKGHVYPGEVIVGTDSHTCTYGALGAFSTGIGSTDMASGMATGKAWFKVPSAISFNVTGELAPNVGGKDVILHIIGEIGVDGALYKSMEFNGPGIKSLSMDDRFCISNMVIEAGAKNGIFPVDEITEGYIKDRIKRPYIKYEADPDAVYEKIINIDLSRIRPKVAFPHLPENTKSIEDVEDIEIDQVVIGSCTNGRLSDMAIAAEILKGKRVHPRVRAIIIPATQQVYKDCIRLGYAEMFIDAGCVISTPTCGPCLGGYMGILAEGERCVATTNRNFVGRMGHTKSEIFLTGPAVAAASAIAGKITL